ncbi:MAG: class I poly(R)-hydroxyalkanoic acid synthase [Gammaproteobacteria bacterium]|nr:class I poly(R)-hydroxyalkanoic acid synthase [Gammaproteobacteria bacterium]
MAEKSNEPVGFPDPVKISEAMARIARQSQGMVEKFAAQLGSGDEHAYGSLNLHDAGKTFQEMLGQMCLDPSKLAETQMQFWNQYQRLTQQTLERFLGQEPEPVMRPESGDKRFKHEDWESSPVFDYIKQTYLLASRYIYDTVEQVEGLDEKTSQKVDFYTRQFVDALAPSNFVATNPRVLQQTVDTGGENLLDGLSNLLGDLEAGQGRLRIRMTDIDKFTLGENVAVTPGKVVYQNELMQLLQYSPTTDEVYRVPLLIFPPWINKYYILDLRPENSFIQWAVDQGHSVFVISWVNPDEKLSQKDFEDYLLEGPIEALAAIHRATGESEVNAIGYCLGGTLLACTLAYIKAREHEYGIRSATFFTTMIDFSDPGELGAFIDEEQINTIEEEMEKKGYLDGAKMAETFNLLRANDLIWNFVINNYLMGKDPFPFDLLYWNSDSTRMPYAMHSFYLRNMYQNNLLKTPGGISLNETPIDVSAIDTPAYILATKEDHIAPWTSAYAATQLYSGPARFVLGGSGHIAGVINPPSAQKYGYWVGNRLPENPQEWLSATDQHDGSWWLDWQDWVAGYAGDKVAARRPGDSGLEVLEDAPGSYVKTRA